MTKETVICSAAISKNWQVALRAEVRPWLKPIKPGDRLEFVVVDGKVHIRVEGAKK